MEGYFTVRKIFEPYLEATGSVQSWNMFAGTPPRYPQVFMVEIFPQGGAGWIPFQDMNWGSKDLENIHFRHVQVQGNLAAPGWDREREWYANYWARRWNRLHSSRPARYVRFYYWRLTTPSPDRIRAGDSNRHPQLVQDWIWEVPKDVHQ
jgi:hypothetical protein